MRSYFFSDDSSSDEEEEKKSAAPVVKKAAPAAAKESTYDQNDSYEQKKPAAKFPAPKNLETFLESRYFRAGSLFFITIIQDKFYSILIF